MIDRKKIDQWIVIQERKGGPALAVLQAWRQEVSPAVKVQYLDMDFGDDDLSILMSRAAASMLRDMYRAKYPAMAAEAAKMKARDYTERFDISWGPPFDKLPETYTEREIVRRDFEYRSRELLPKPHEKGGYTAYNPTPTKPRK